MSSQHHVWVLGRCELLRNEGVELADYWVRITVFKSGPDVGGTTKGALSVIQINTKVDTSRRFLKKIFTLFFVNR